MSLALAVGLGERGEIRVKFEIVLFSLRIVSLDSPLAGTGHSESESISDLLKIHYRSFHIQMADDRQDLWSFRSQSAVHLGNWTKSKIKTPNVMTSTRMRTTIKGIW